MAAAVLGVGVLQEIVPDDFRVLPRLVYPIILLGFLGVLILGDPGRIDRQRRWLRVTTLLMFGLITLATASALPQPRPPKTTFCSCDETKEAGRN